MRRNLNTWTEVSWAAATSLVCLLQELVEDVAVAASSRHADLSWARRFAVATPRFIGRRSASTRGCASLSITSSARTSTDNISASRATSSAKSRSVKDSFFFPMVVPTMPPWTVRSKSQSIGTRTISGATPQPCLTPLKIGNHSELEPSTPAQLVVSV